MYVLTPELALMIKRNELSGEHLLDEMAMEATDIINEADEIEAAEGDAAHAEHMAKWDELGFTVGDEPTDIASEIEPSVWDKYMPNDGTPLIEHRLRKQGLRKASDSEREEVLDLRIELYNPITRRAERRHVLRQRGGDLII